MNLRFLRLVQHVLFVSVAAAVAAEPNAKVLPAELDAFMQKWRAIDPSNSPTNITSVPFLLAALEQDPKGPWANYILRNASMKHALAGRSGLMTRTNLYRETFSYLAPARATLAEALARGEKVQHTYDQILGNMAKAALESGAHLGEAKGAAREMISNNVDTRSWNYGNIDYDANSLLGRVALREGKIDDAKKFLLAAGQTKGSPQLNSFGPDFTLARELAEVGEKETVLEFLDLVAVFWANPEERKNSNSKSVASGNRELLAAWKKEITAGKVPAHYKWQ
jgi:hypothetical protein